MKYSKVFFQFTWLAVFLAFPALGEIPAPERLLPDDTLVLVTAPDFAKLSDVIKKAPQAQLWNDPAMKPFKDKFLTKWNDEIVKPLEKELGIKFEDYTSLPQGQVTLAVTQNAWKGHDDEEPGLLLLVDARSKADQLKKNLADLRKKWVDAGKTLRTEKLRDVEFVIVSVSSNDVPKAVRNLFPKSSPVQELGDETPEKKSEGKVELVIGQADSLLIAGSSLSTVEKVLVRLKGGSAPSLAEHGAYQANHMALFRESPFYGWVNVKRFMDILVPIWSQKKENPDAPNPFDLPVEKIVGAIGLTGLKSIAFSTQQTAEGGLLQAFFTVPEANRQGLFKIIAGEPKESAPPPFVPADAVKFQRWRIDGRKAWATVEKTVGDISPQAVNTLNFLIDSANTYAKEKDPGFDLRKNLIGNLGDDIISYQKAPRGQTAEQLASPPSLLLIGSSNPEQIVGALKGLLVFLSQQAGAPPEEREFLGRKIQSVTLRLPGRAAGAGKPPVLSYAASSGYVAFATDASMIEEYLRTCDSQPKPLREIAGLADARQKVIGPGSSLFGYQNDAENMRTAIEALKKLVDAGTSGAASSSLLSGAAGLAGTEKVKEWMDFSLLPPFEKISKYFGMTVYGGSATVDGLSLKLFAPVPPGLKK